MMFTWPLVNITLYKSYYFCPHLITEVIARDVCVCVCVWNDIKKGGHCVLTLSPPMQAHLSP